MCASTRATFAAMAGVPGETKSGTDLFCKSSIREEVIRWPAQQLSGTLSSRLRRVLEADGAFFSITFTQPHFRCDHAPLVQLPGEVKHSHTALSCRHRQVCQ